MKRKRWTGRFVAGLLALTPSVGCKQQIFTEPADYKDALAAATIGRLETAPHDAITPPAIIPDMTPSTVLDPTRPAKWITLKECIALALEQGNVGLPPGTNAGLSADALPQFTGRGTTGTDTIKAFALDPSIQAAEIERSLSKFDARYVSSMTWQKVDQAQPAEFQASLQNGDQAALATTLAKPLPTGGTAGITFNTTYRNLSNPPVAGQISSLPTTYSPQLQFSFEQPLLQSFGVEINQLLQQHPGSLLIPGLQPSGGVGVEGILVTRIRLDQQRSEFDRSINNMLWNVEAAYWNLYSAYYNLYAQEQGLKESYDAFRIIAERAEGGLTRPQSLYQYRAQIELFRAQVLTARGEVLTAERNLRSLLGMRSDENNRLVPIDDPTLVPYNPEFYELATETMQSRPELLVAREELKAQQMNILLQKNNRRPDLRLLSQYDVNAIGTRLDGVAPQNAFNNLTLNNFNNWQVGLRLNMPIGFRDANALVRQAELNLKKAYFHLTDAERKAFEELVRQYRTMVQAHELIKFRRAQREALQTFVALNIEVFLTGAVGQGEFEGFIANLVQAQRDLANATAQEFQAIAQYNSAIAGVEWAKGTIQRYNNVTISDGPAPPWVEKKAADHFAAREAALKLREHPAEIAAPPLSQWAPLTDLPPTPGPVGVPPPPPSAGSGFDSVVPLLDQKLDKPKELPSTIPGTAPRNGGESLPAPPPEAGSRPLLQTGPATAPKPKAVAVPLPSPKALGVEPVSLENDATFKPIGTVTIPARSSRPAAAPAIGGPSPNPVMPIPTNYPALPSLPVQGVGGVSPIFNNSPALR